MSKSYQEVKGALEGLTGLEWWVQTVNLGSRIPGWDNKVVETNVTANYASVYRLSVAMDGARYKAQIFKDKVCVWTGEHRSLIMIVGLMRLFFMDEALELSKFAPNVMSMF